jgi:hypothetical protein
MEATEKPIETLLLEALRRVGLGDAVRLAENIVNHEIIPALCLAGVDPEFIVGIDNPYHLFTKKGENGFSAVVIRNYDDIEYIGKYLGQDKMDYRSSIAMIKARGSQSGFDCLYGILLVSVKNHEHPVRCYYLIASGFYREKKD